MTLLVDAMRAFYDMTVSLDVADSVTAFRASDFGRTASAHNGESDRGLGSRSFVLGREVQGKLSFGAPPAIGDNTPDDVG